MPLRQPQSGFDDIQVAAFMGQYGANAQYEDFNESSTATANFQDLWDNNTNGGQLQFDNLNVQGHPGVVSLHTIAGGATNKVSISSTYASFPLSYAFWNVAWILQLPVLSGGADQYILRAGLGTRQSSVNEFTNGCYFEYDSSVSANWRGVIARLGARTKVNGTIPVTTSYLTLNIQGNASSCTFQVNGVDAGVGTLSGANFPFGLFIVPSVQLYKTVGLTDMVCNCDLAFLRVAFGSNR
jgi:hypothetical protein